MMLDGEMMDILRDLADRYTQAANLLYGDDGFLVYQQRADALKMAIDRLVQPEWCLTAKDGNPDEAGNYYVIVIYPECRPDHDLSKRYAELTTRYCNEYNPDDGWVMKGQPDHGMVWYEDSGSSPNEYVYAWLPVCPVKDDIELPKGVEWA